MDWELVFWCVAGAICFIFFALCILPINWEYCEKDDPYKYCPKEEE